MIEPHPKPKDRIAASKWAAGVLAERHRIVFLDTETTGLGPRDEVIQIAILDIDGNELCKTLLAMTKRKTIPRAASDVHGIKKKDLEGQPTYAQVSHNLEAVLRGKRIIAYNAEFDFRMMHQTYAIAGGYRPDLAQWECAMKVYAAFYGEIHPYFGDYKWQRLGGSHDAADDVVQLIQLVKRMAAHYEALQADKRLEQELRTIQARIAGIKAARASRRVITSLKAFSYSLQEFLDSTGIPAYVTVWVAGCLISLLPLLLFGSLLATLLTFGVVACLCGLFALRNTGKKHDVLQGDREKLARVDAALERTRQELELKKKWK
jgi:DNA polymerase III epsilon subunit-like protein